MSVLSSTADIVRPPCHAVSCHEQTRVSCRTRLASPFDPWRGGILVRLTWVTLGRLSLAAIAPISMPLIKNAAQLRN